MTANAGNETPKKRQDDRPPEGDDAEAQRSTWEVEGDEIDALLEEVDQLEVQQIQRRPPSERPVRFVPRTVALPEGLVEAKVVSSHGSHFRARADSCVYFVHLARKLLIQKRELAHPISVGDDIWLKPVPSEGTDEPQALLVAIRTRRTQLSRPAVGRGGGKGRGGGHRHQRHGGATRGKEGVPQQVMVANVDQVLVTVACVPEGDIRINLIDRFLVAAARNELEAAVLFNKADILSPARRAEYLAVLELYRTLGVPALLTAAPPEAQGTAEGIEPLREWLRERTSVFAGQSGVGKTSLLNALAPELAMRVAPVNRKTGRGRHTTTSVTLLPLPFGGYIVDTPGIREFGLHDVAAEDVDAFYPEIAEQAQHCAFRDCSHSGREPNCAVLAAVEAGHVDRRRHDSYLALRHSLG